MIDRESKIAVNAAITRLISGTDETWIDDARTVLDAAMFLEATRESEIDVRTKDGLLPSIRQSAAFGGYALLGQPKTSSVVIETLNALVGTDEQTSYRIFYDDDSYEPLTFVRMTYRLENPANMSRRRRFIMRVLAAYRAAMNRLRPGSMARTSYWEVTRSVILYSAVPEYQPGDELPLG